MDMMTLTIRMHRKATRKPTIQNKVSSETWSYSDWCVLAAAISSAFTIVVTLLGAYLAKVESKVKEDAFRSDLGKANAIAALANEGQAKANESAALANERAALLEKEAAFAKLELGQLKERQGKQAPRSFSEEQRNKILSLLNSAPKGKVEIITSVGDPEAVGFMHRISRLLTEAGYEIHANEVVMFPTPIGLTISVRSQSEAPPYAAHIQNAFSVSGWPMPGTLNPDRAAGTLEITVGGKPPTE